MRFRSGTGVQVTGGWPAPRAGDQACIGRGVSYTLGLTSSSQPVCQGIRAHPRDVMEGYATNQRTPRAEGLARNAVLSSAVARIIEV